MSMRHRRAFIALAGLIAATWASTAQAGDGGRTPIPLPPIEGDLSSEARAVNNRGQVAGSSFDGILTATIWDWRGKPTPLAPLEGDGHSEAFAINDWGEAVGDSTGAITSAVRWDRQGVASRLAPPEGDLDSFARGINARGEVAGYSSRQNDADADTGVLLQAVRWDAWGNPTVLPPLEGDSEATALAINAFGKVVGYSFSSGGRDTAVVWNRSGRPRALLPLPGDGGSEAQAINLWGQVVGDSEDGSETATRWPRAQPKALAALARDPDAQAFAINRKGAIAGVSISLALIHSAVLWASGGRPVRLAALPGNDQSWALGINESGDVVGFSAGETSITAVLWPAPRRAPRHGHRVPTRRH